MGSERSSRVAWRWFWAWDDDREERWLADMARQGWHLRGPAVLRFTFDRGEPAEVVYRLDYHILRGEERAEYLALFRAAGWEHVGEVANWHYFRTPAADGAAADIFSDAESRAAKYRRLLVLLLALLPILLSSFSRLLRRPSGEPPRLLGWLLNGSLVFYVALLVLLAYVLVRIALKIRSVRAGGSAGETVADEAATPGVAAAVGAAPRTRMRRVPVLTVALATLVVGGNLLFRPFFACRADDPATLHAALGTHPAWSPPTARDAFLALRYRFPERVGGDPEALPEAELARLYLVRPNAVSSALHWASGAALVLAAALVDLRRSRRRAPPLPRL